MVPTDILTNAVQPAVIEGGYEEEQTRGLTTGDDRQVGNVYGVDLSEHNTLAVQCRKRWRRGRGGIPPFVSDHAGLVIEEVKAAALDRSATKVRRVKGHVDTSVNLGLYPTLTPPRSARRPKP